jgi:hypothetical protein
MTRQSLPARILAHPLLWGIAVYRVTLSPFVGRQCRYEPTCSRYGAEALRRYGALRGGWMAVARVLRCHPWAAGGYDPVPWPDDPQGREPVHLPRANIRSETQDDSGRGACAHPRTEGSE